MSSLEKFSISGDLNFSTVAQLNPEAYLAKVDRLELDVSQLAKVDSAGIAWLIDWYRRAKQCSNEAVCVQIGAQLRDLLQVYEIDFLLKE